LPIRPSTSVDYGNGKDKDTLKRGDYLEWCFRWLDEFMRVVKPGGAIFVYNLPQWAFHLASHLEAGAMTFRHWIAVSMKGTFPRGNKLYPAHYALLSFTKGIPKAPKTFNRVRLPIPSCRHCGKDQKDNGGHRKYLNPLGINLTISWEDTVPPRPKTTKGLNRMPLPQISPYLSRPEMVFDPIWALPDRTRHTLGDAENSPVAATAQFRSR
jgi:site-specific DNA-methyltransferase (adenine-specific)